VSAEFHPGEFNMILGPNGSGKSTFLKIFSGEIHANEGNVFYAEKQIRTIKTDELAKYRAVMSQQPELSFPLTVDEVVMMGRYPHFNFNPNKKDESICGEVMERMNLRSFSDRNYLTLSGGEKQRVQFARVLAQVWEQPQAGYRYLFLDEPLASLDIKYQQEFLQVAREFVKTGTVLIAVLHDINLAIQYADRGIRVSVLCPQSVQTGMTTPGPSAARVDGVLQPPEVARMVIEAMEAERFLILSHPQVQEYMQRKASSIDRWLTGMRRLRDKTYGAPRSG